MKECSISDAKMLKKYKQIGMNVKKIRKEKNVTQLALSLAIGHKAVGTVSMAELCIKNKHFNIEHLYKIASKSYLKILKDANDLNINWQEIEKSVLIRSMDTLWVEHLEAMSSVRQGIGLRGYGQRDPLIEYKKEAFRLYGELNALIQKEVVYSIFKVGTAQTASGQAKRAINGFEAPGLADRATSFSAPAKTMDSSSASFSGFKSDKLNNDSKSGDLVKQKLKNADGEKVGRNDPCPCGSGKKYKKCCG